MNVLKKYKVMAKSKKESHLARLVKSLGTISTARTPISSAYPTKPKRSDLPNVLNRRQTRSPHTRVLSADVGNAPSLSSKTYPSWSGKSGWNKQSKSYATDYGNYQSALSLYKKKLTNLNTSQVKQRQMNKIRNSKSGITSVISSLKGSRGYSRGSGSRG